MSPGASWRSACADGRCPGLPGHELLHFVGRHRRRRWNEPGMRPGGGRVFQQLGVEPLGGVPAHPARRFRQSLPARGGRRAGRHHGDGQTFAKIFVQHRAHDDLRLGALALMCSMTRLTSAILKSGPPVKTHQHGVAIPPAPGRRRASGAPASCPPPRENARGPPLRRRQRHFLHADPATVRRGRQNESESIRVAPAVARRRARLPTSKPPVTSERFHDTGLFVNQLADLLVGQSRSRRQLRL